MRFAPGKVGWIAQPPRIGDIKEAADGEAWIERKPRLNRGVRLVQLPEPRQRSREMEMRDGIVSIGLKAPTKPRDRFGVGIKLYLGKADPHQPSVG